MKTRLLLANGSTHVVISVDGIDMSVMVDSAATAADDLAAHASNLRKNAKRLLRNADICEDAAFDFRHGDAVKNPEFVSEENQPSDQSPDVEFYREFLVSRIFAFNHYGSASALLEAINQANAIPAEGDTWRASKDAFNQIAMKAPMLDGDGYVITYREVPAFIDAEVSAFQAARQTEESRYKRSANSLDCCSVI